MASYDIPTEGGTIDVTFRANQDWRITLAPANSKSNTAGVSVSPSFGAGSNKPITVTVKASANTDLKREIVLSILGQATEAAVRLIQPGANDPHEVWGTLNNPYQPSKIIEEMLAGSIPAGEVYVRGIVSKVNEISAQYGNATFFLTDDGTHPDDANQAFQIYRGKSFDGASFVEGDESLFKEGDVVTVFGLVTLYNGKTPETQSGKASLVAVNGLAKADGEGTEESPLNVGKAMELIQATGETATPEYYVKGVISKIVEVSPSYGNATYYITDDGFQPSPDAAAVQVYRGKWFGGEAFTDAEQIKLGDQVVLKGTLVNYSGNTPEVNSGSAIVLLNGTKPE